MTLLSVICLIPGSLNRNRKPNLTSFIISTTIIFGVLSFLAMTIVVKDSWTIRNDEFPHLPPWPDYLAQVSKTKFQVAPAILKVHCDVKDSIFVQTNPFYTFEGGHLISLRVNLNGHGKGESTHVSIYLHLMKGPHDDKLEYSGHLPLRGMFGVQLLNQLNDHDHYYYNITYITKLPHQYINRASEDDIAAEGWGKSRFISHELLRCNGSCCYHMNNFLYFRVSFKNDSHQRRP